MNRNASANDRALLGTYGAFIVAEVQSIVLTVFSEVLVFGSGWSN
jgi:hypothetical protein